MKSNDVFELLKGKKNVNGVYWGKMYKEGKYKGMGWVVTVSRKLSSSKLKEQDIIPKMMPDRADTDVKEQPEFKTLVKPNDERHRPFPCGVSIGHVDITAGTLGLIVRRNGDDFALSNNHVLADVNKGELGDPVVQPGKHDGGRDPEDVVAHLEEFEPIAMVGEDPDCSTTSKLIKFFNYIYEKLGSGVRLKAERNVFNLVDCAIARLLYDPSKELYKRSILNVGNAAVIDVAQVDDEVVKSGRTTGVTNGTVVSVDATSSVNMGADGMAVFADQIIIEGDGFSAGGDSGSSILRNVDGNDHAVVGLLFAGNGQMTIANKIHNVFDALGVTL